MAAGPCSGSLTYILFEFPFPGYLQLPLKKKKTWSISNQNTASPNSGDSVLFCFFTSGPKLTFMHGIILGHLIFSQIFFTIKTVKEKMQYIEDEHSVYITFVS